MTSPAGLIDFFIMEASDYVEQIDGVLARAAGAAPDAEALQRSARALRGSATMARLSPFAELAAAVERVARAMRGGSLPWEPALAGAVTAAIDDLKLLLRAARNWTATEEQRARSRTAELTRYAPERATPATPTVSSAASFLAGETSNIAAGIELVVARPDDREGAANVLRRIRAIRGLAGIREIPLLGEAMESAESAAKALELGEAPLGPEAIALMRASAAVLRASANALRDGHPADLASERARFHDTLDRWQDAEAARDRIVPIRQLYFADAGPHLVELAPSPPTYPHQRFRLEMVSQVEHLRGLVADARIAPDEAARERMRRELRRTLRTLSDLATSFGEGEIAEFVDLHLESARSLDAAGLDEIDQMAAVLSRPDLEGDALTEQIEQVLTERAAVGTIGAPLRGGEGAPSGALPAPPTPPAQQRPSGVGRPMAPPTPSTAPTPVVAPPPARPTAPPPARPAAAAPTTPVAPAPTHSGFTPARGATSVPAPARSAPPLATPHGLTPPHGGRVATPAAGEALSSALDSGIAGLDALSLRPLTPSAPLPEQPPVPIGQLLYRGRAALERAIEIRDLIRTSGSPPTPEALGELYDLLDLALAG